MYNGIGLETPRGTGTSGYVQANKAHVSARQKRDSYRRNVLKSRESDSLRDDVNNISQTKSYSLLKKLGYLEIEKELKRLGNDMENNPNKKLPRDHIDKILKSKRKQKRQALKLRLKRQIQNEKAKESAAKRRRLNNDMKKLNQKTLSKASTSQTVGLKPETLSSNQNLQPPPLEDTNDGDDAEI